MVKRQVTLKVHDAHGSWTETYVEGARSSFNEAHQNLEEWAKLMVQEYNDTLRPGEKERVLDGVVVEKVDVPDEGDGFEEDEDSEDIE